MDCIWPEIVITAPAGALERAEAALHMSGSLGLYIEDYSDIEDALKPFNDMGLVDEALIAKERSLVVLHAYFPPGDNPAERVADIRDRLLTAGLAEGFPDTASPDDGAGCPAPRFSITDGVVAEEDWAENWKKYYKPIRVGERILIMPDWEVLEQHDEALLDGVKAVVRIDPGMAFGTGSHATTRLCLTLVEKYTSGGDMLDLGCGSGILAITAALLGARSALGVDSDAYAVRNARENAKRNAVTDITRFVGGDLIEGLAGQYALIAANIVADALIRLLDAPVKKLLSPGGVIVLSGIIAERESDVAYAAAGNGFRIADTLREEGWTAFALLCK